MTIAEIVFLILIIAGVVAGLYDVFWSPTARAAKRLRSRADWKDKHR